jgi:hypothetical protein
MFAIETSASWWGLVDSYWDDLMALVDDCGLGDRTGELNRCRRSRDRRLVDYLVSIRRTAGRHGQRRHSLARQLLADLCLDQSILYQAVVWRS